MINIENLIDNSIKDRLVEVTSKPKRRKITHECVASTDEHREAACRELRWEESQRRVVPVLFICGEPRRRLSDKEASEYKSLGARVENLPLNEVKKLNL